MISSGSIIYKLDDGSDIFDEEEVEMDESSSEVLYTIQNNLVDLHSLGCYLLLTLSILIGVGVLLCFRK